MKNRLMLFKHDSFYIFLRKVLHIKLSVKAKMTVVSLVKRSLAAETRCYATRIWKVFAMPQSHFSVCLHELGRNRWLLIMLFWQRLVWNPQKVNMWYSVSLHYSGNIELQPPPEPIYSWHYSTIFSYSRNILKAFSLMGSGSNVNILGFRINSGSGYISVF